jgi:hypothetical protein
MECGRCLMLRRHEAFCRVRLAAAADRVPELRQCLSRDTAHAGQPGHRHRFAIENPRWLAQRHGLGAADIQTVDAMATASQMIRVS